MGFPFNVTIRKTANGYEYDPPELTGLEIGGDQVIWVNDDDVPHWPGLVTPTGIVDNYFMAYQVAPHSTSGAFVPGAAGSFTYVDSLDPAGPTGTIVVG